MAEIVGIWTGNQEAHVLNSNGIDVTVDAHGHEQIRVEGLSLPLYEDRLEELLQDPELSNNALFEILLSEFPEKGEKEIWEDCKDKTFVSEGRDPIHS